MKFVISFILFFPVLGFSHKYRSDIFCSDDSQLACAHIGYDAEFVANSPTEFIFHITTPGAEKIDKIELYLWMEELGLGTDPVKIEKVGAGKFLVKDFVFPVRGTWEIRAEFDYLFFHQIIIPVSVF